MSSSKLFIVAPDRSDLLASLQRAIGHEPGVEIFYDRRTGGGALSPDQVDRRHRPEVAVQIEERGFAVVTRASPIGNPVRRRRI